MNANCLFRFITRYLEAATVAALSPPDAVLEFNEGHFEQAAQSAHERFGLASPRSLNLLLAEFGFPA